MSYITMFDSNYPDQFPPDPQAIAGYVTVAAGQPPDFDRLRAMYPNALHLSIADFPDYNADCLDIERGAAEPADAPAWVRRRQGLGAFRPCVYASVSRMPEVIATLRGNGITRREVRLWTAHYTTVPHLCTPACGHGFAYYADATQWRTDALGKDLDESRCLDTFFGPPPPPPDPHHYLWYPTGPFSWTNPVTERSETLSERRIVQTYDHLRVHARMNHERLDELRAHELTFLRKRVWYVAHYELTTGRRREQPDWTSFHRGWRWQKLLARTRGESVV
jgi:hypothetical protein